MTIPTFKTQEHEDEFVLLFEQRAQIYVTLMNKVKESAWIMPRDYQRHYRFSPL
jgi:hypothetical protein